MKTIHRYDLAMADEQFVAVPKDTRMLPHVAASDRLPVEVGGFTLWGLVDMAAIDKNEVERHRILVRGTGHRLLNEDVATMAYVGTFQMMSGALVFHVFAEKVQR